MKGTKGKEGKREGTKGPFGQEKHGLALPIENCKAFEHKTNPLVLITVCAECSRKATNHVYLIVI